jgi:vitamin B12 transporter
MNKKLVYAVTLSVLVPLLSRAETPPVVQEGDEEGLFLTLNRKEDDPQRLPTNISTLTAEDLRREKPAVMEEALSLLPGVYIQRSGPLGTFSTLRLRGVPSSSQVLILVDDVPLGGVGSQFADLSQIPMETVDRIEIVRGGGSALYGANAVGGVVNILTKKAKGEGTQTSIKGDIRSYGTQIYQGDFSVKANGWDGYVNAGRYLSDGFQENQDAENVYGAGKAGYTFGSGTRLGIELQRMGHKVGNPWGTPVPLGEWDGKKEKKANDSTARIEKDSTRARATAAVPLSSALWQTSVWGYFEKVLDTESSFGYADTDRRKGLTGGDTRLNWGHRFVLGASLERDQRRNLKVGDDVKKDHVTNAGTFAQATLPWGQWEFLPALRWDHHSAFGSEVDPRLTVVYQADKNLKFSANAARSFRAPDMAALYDDFPEYPANPYFPGIGETVHNPDVQPEIGWAYDAGVERQLGESVTVRATGFYTKLKDRIYTTSFPAGQTNTTLNGPSAEMSGAEVEGDVLFPVGRLATQYTYLRAIGNSANSSEFLALRLSPRHSASAELNLNGPNKLILTNTVRYLHCQFTTDGDKGSKLPSFTLWNARLSKTILAAEFYLSVDNITDKHYTESIGFDPMPGRTFGAGATIRFLN